MSQHLETYNYVNGQYVSAAQSVISINDIGFLRGYGVFDYIQSYEGVLFHAEDHIDRLIQSASKIDIQLLKSKDEILNILDKLIEINPKINAGIRIVVTAGSIAQDLISPDNNPHCYVIFHPFNKIDNRFYTHGLKAVFSTHLRVFPEVKTTFYMPAILSIKKAKSLGYDDILYLDSNDDILEASTSNLFFLKNGVWITDDSSRILKGVTRKIIIELMRDNYQIEFRALKKNELSDCQEAFLCSSAKEIMPLVEVEGESIGSGKPGPQTIKLAHLFREYVKNSNPCVTR